MWITANTQVLSQRPGSIVGGRATSPVWPKLSERERCRRQSQVCQLYNAL